MAVLQTKGALSCGIVFYLSCKEAALTERAEGSAAMAGVHGLLPLGSGLALVQPLLKKSPKFLGFC